MTRVYYREAMGAFIVFDVTRPTTFEAVIKWKQDLDSKLMLANGQSIATVLLANKCDQGRELTNNGIRMDQFCKDHGFVGWFETSAKVRADDRLLVLASVTQILADTINGGFLPLRSLGLVKKHPHRANWNFMWLCEVYSQQAQSNLLKRNAKCMKIPVKEKV